MNLTGNYIPQLGILPVPPKALGELYGVVIKSVNLLMACATQSLGVKADKRITDLFKGKTQVTLKEYAFALGYATWDQYPDVIVRKVPAGNNKAARQEWQDVILLLKDIQAQAH